MLILFQVLPFTIDQGPLNDKAQVFAAVSKMLGENGNVLCPGISEFQLSSYESKILQHSMLQLTDNQKEDLTPSFRKYNCKPNEQSYNAFKKASTNKLLQQLNREMSKTRENTKYSAKDNRCLLWHIPVSGGKGRTTDWPDEAKWCTNCLKKL